MKNFRLKDHLLGYGLLICLAWISNLAMAQDWPSKPIKLILPAPAGTGPDVDIRKIGKHLSAILGQPIVIENRPGAATRIGVEAAIRSAPDGYTFLVGTPSLTTMQALYPKLNFDPKKDLIPVSLTAITNYTLSVNAQVPAKNLVDYVEIRSQIRQHRHLRLRCRKSPGGGLVQQPGRSGCPLHPLQHHGSFRRFGLRPNSSGL